MTTIVDKLRTKILNAGSAAQEINRFNVRFLGIPENISDFLSRGVRNVNPPAITFATTNHGNRRASFQDVGKLESEILTITLMSDDEGIMDGIIMSQIFRQKGDEISGFEGTKSQAKFDIKLEILNTNSKVVRSETYRNCFIATLQKPDLENTQAATNALYTLTIQYDSIDYSIEDESFVLTS